MLDLKRDIPGLQTRYRGGALASGVVSTWTDEVNGRNFTSSGVNRPTAGPSYEGGARGAVRCYSTGATVPQRMDAANTTDHAHLHDPAGSTLMLAVVPRGTTTGIILNSFGSSYANGRGVWVEWSPGGTQFNVYYSRSGTSIGGAGTGAGTGVLGKTCVITVRLIPTTTKFNIRTNGTQRVNNTWSTPSSGASAYPLRIGEYANAGGTPFDGDVLEIATWNRALSDDECTRVESAWTALYAPGPLTPTSAPIATAITGTVRILCLGDSTTLGTTAATVRLGGYRQRIDEVRGAQPFAFDFVGSQSYGPGFADNQHDGRSGWVIDNRINPGSTSGHTTGSTNAGDIGDELAAVDPHIVAIYLGFNTINGGTDAIVLSRDMLTDYLTLITEIHTLKPNARIVVVPLTLITGNGNAELRRVAFNIGLAALVRAAREMGINVAIADTANLLTAGDIEVPFGLHPVDSGYQKLGDAIIAAIKYAAGFA